MQSVDNPGSFSPKMRDFWQYSSVGGAYEAGEMHEDGGGVRFPTRLGE